MSQNELVTKIESLNEWEALMQEAKEQAEAIRDSIKAEMLARWIYQCAESACPVFWKSPVRKEEITVPDRE